MSTITFLQYMVQSLRFITPSTTGMGFTSTSCSPRSTKECYILHGWHGSMLRPVKSAVPSVIHPWFVFTFDILRSPAPSYLYLSWLLNSPLEILTTWTKFWSQLCKFSPTILGCFLWELIILKLEN